MEWEIIVGLGAALTIPVGAVIAMGVRLSRVEEFMNGYCKKVDKVEEKIERLEGTNTEMLVSLGKINTELEHIKVGQAEVLKDLSFIREKVK